MIENRGIKILAYVHGYFPNHNAGAEAMLHQILCELRDRGHEVKVLTRDPEGTEYEGIPIFEAGLNKDHLLADWADVIFTHLDFTRIAVKLGNRHRKPVVHLVHNDRQLSYHKILDKTTAAFAIANSDWIRGTIKRTIPSLVVYPPTKTKRYQVEASGDAITLINMNEAKGGKVFWQLARVFPEKQFIGVRGAYGEQVEYDKELPNVTILKNTSDITDVYKKTRIVIMPSSYESWGRVAIEAGCSGIPVIASPTPGLEESLGIAGVFAKHDDLADWIEAIRSLDDPKLYEKHSKLMKKRAKELDGMFDEQMDSLEQKLLAIL
jgi:glycosyltransferase involved in cell wall biosynthesis